MSKETINLDLSLAPPQHLSQPQSPPAVQEPLRESVQESVEESQLEKPQISHIQNQATCSTRNTLLSSRMSKEAINLDLSLAPPKHLSQPQFLLEYDQLQQLIPQETQPEEEITTLHPWTKSTAAEVHTLNYLLSKNINKISGEMMCKSCKKMERLEYNLRDKFAEVCKYIKGNAKQLRHRASEKWMNPELGKCGDCRKGTLKPVISEKEEEINWLFLMLGQMLGCCRRDQLQYFCDKNSQHKVAAKDRLVYLAYVVICNQLDPTLSFEL